MKRPKQNQLHRDFITPDFPITKDRVVIFTLKPRECYSTIHYYYDDLHLSYK